jgi:hypothetical protein
MGAQGAGDSREGKDAAQAEGLNADRRRCHFLLTVARWCFIEETPLFRRFTMDYSATDKNHAFIENHTKSALRNSRNLWNLHFYRQSELSLILSGVWYAALPEGTHIKEDKHGRR